ncbi:MAG: hypothetical protein KBS45_05665 [Clostridiales bacterium]|nr:hypothetical protein [Candidatus Coliplasma caballi]
MENKNIMLLRHHPMNVFYTNPFYTNQTEEDLSDYVIIDVTSRAGRDKAFLAEHPDFDRQLSPFWIGPVISSDGTPAQIFEIFWQCGKVYPCHDDGGKPNEDYFRWRNEFYAAPHCTKDLMRHANKSLGYEHKDTRYFAFFDKEKGEYVPLSFTEARKKAYFPEYAKLVYNTPAFLWMKSLVDAGKKIALVDFDNYNYNEECAMKKKYEQYVNKCKQEKREPTIPKSAFLAVRSMKDAVNCSFMSAGHGFVIKALLQGDLEVMNGEVVDHAGILE